MTWLPNLLTLLRVLLTPFIVRDILDGHCHIALPLSMFAGFTDVADGFLARHFGWNSRFGAWLDPIADKVLLTSLYVSFGIAGLVPPWLVWLVVGRDVAILAMAAAAMVLTSIRDFSPSIWGKLTTLLQITGAIIVLAACTRVQASKQLLLLTVAAVALVTLLSGVDYVRSALLRFRATQQKV